MTVSDPKWADLLRRRMERDQRARDLAAAGRPLRMRHANAPSHRALAGPDMAGDDAYRLTFLDDRGPSGHCCFHTLAEAILEGLRGGYEPEEPHP